MTTVKVSEKGQITLPIDIRRKYGVSAGELLEVEERDEGMLLRRVKTVRELEGIFAHAPIPGMTHDKEIDLMEEAVAREVMSD